MTSFEIELFGGANDGKTMTWGELPNHLNTIAPHPPVTFTADPEPMMGALDYVTYTLERNRVTGEPRRTPEGRVIYRHGPRPAAPADLPHWVEDAFPRAHSWLRLGKGSWRAQEPHLGSRYNQVLCVLTVTRDGRTAYSAQRLDPSLLRGQDAEAIGLRVFQELAHQCDDLLLPPCVVQGCGKKGRMLLHAAADGRLAGRDWRNGDEIRFCLRHYSDVWRAVGTYDVDQLAEWLRPDAVTEPDWKTDLLGAVAFWRAGGRRLHLLGEHGPITTPPATPGNG